MFAAFDSTRAISFASRSKPVGLLDEANLSHLKIFASIAYKLTEYAGTGRMKLSTGKRTLPGQKQVFRESRDGRAVRDVIGRFDETLPGRPLLAPVMRKGRRLPYTHPTLAAIRAYARDALGELPDDVQALAPVEHAFDVAISPLLDEDERHLREQLMTAIRSTAGGSG